MSSGPPSGGSVRSTPLTSLTRSRNHTAKSEESCASCEGLLGIGALEPDQHERASVGILLNRPRLPGDAAALLRLVIPGASRPHRLLGEGASCVDLAREHRERTVENCHRPASLALVVALPRHAVRDGGLGDALQLHGPTILEAELLADAELAHSERRRDLARRCRITQTSCELHGGPEEVVVVVGDGLAGADADLHVERNCIALVVSTESPLRRDRERDRRGDGGERRHDSVARVLDLSPVMGTEALPNDLVVNS